LPLFCLLKHAFVARQWQTVVSTINKNEKWYTKAPHPSYLGWWITEEISLKYKK
jgi:hypothetical protein